MSNIYEQVSPAIKAPEFRKEFKLLIHPPADLSFDHEVGSLAEPRTEKLIGTFEVLTTPETVNNEEWGNRSQNQVRLWVFARETSISLSDVVEGVVTLQLDGQEYTAFDYHRMEPVIRLTFEGAEHGSKAE